MKREDLTDAELINLLKADDERALYNLYNRYWDRLLQVAVQRLENLEESQELVQDIFIRLWDRRKEIELKYSLATYLSVAVKYQVINRMDKQHRKRQRENATLLAVAYTSASPEEILVEKELWARLEATIEQLPEKCRIVYRMSRDEGKTHKQIAEALDISESTVEKHIIKALKNIRSDLSASGPIAFLYLLDHYLK